MKPGMGWPIGICVILGATVVANLAVMRIANNDPSFAVEPDYYRKAVFFDSTMAQSQRNLALGWSTDIALDSIVGVKATKLHLTLRDAAHQPLPGLRVEATVLFNARANVQTTATLHDDGTGQYSATMPITHTGEWEVRVSARRDTTHFTSSTRVIAVRANAGGQ